MTASKKRYSISFSIAYVRMCEWSKDPLLYPRPKPAELDDAEVHAMELGDQYILDKIAEIRKFNKKVEDTPTPELPKATKTATDIGSKRLYTGVQPVSAEALNEQLDEMLEKFAKGIL